MVKKLLTEARWVKEKQELARDYIRQVLERNRWRPTELARRIGAHASTVNRFLSDGNLPYALSLKNLMKIRDVGGVEIPPSLAAAYGVGAMPATSTPSTDDDEPSNVGPAPYLGRDSFRKLANDIPLYGTVQAGAEGAFLMNTGEAIDWLRRPLALEGKLGIYALYVEGDSMSPRFYAGERILVNSKQPAANGRDVIIQVRPKKEGDPIRAYLKCLVRRSSDSITVEQFNPPKTMTFKTADILSLHVVLNRDETF